MRISLKCSGKQREGLEWEVQEGFVVGGYGSAKTYELILGVWLDAIRYPKSPQIVASATGPQLKKTSIFDLERFLGEHGVDYRFNRSDLTMVIQVGMGWSAPIYFQSLDVPWQQLKGPNLGSVRVDEAEQMSKQQYEVLLSRVRDPAGHGIMRCYMNPPPLGHWMEEYITQSASSEIGYRTSTTYDNPFITAEYITKMERTYPPGSRGWRRWLMGEIGVPMDGAVYPEFHADMIRPREEFEKADIKASGAGLDFGFNNPTAFILGSLDGDDVLWLHGEHFKNQTLLKDHARAIFELWRANGTQGTVVFADHDKQDVEELKTLGIMTRPAWKMVNPGLDMVRQRIREDRLRIVEGTCPNLVREFGTYVWAQPGPQGTTNPREEPQKKDDHAMDALRYLITGIDRVAERDYGAGRDLFSVTALKRQG